MLARILGRYSGLERTSEERGSTLAPVAGQQQRYCGRAGPQAGDQRRPGLEAQLLVDQNVPRGHRYDGNARGLPGRGLAPRILLAGPPIDRSQTRRSPERAVARETITRNRPEGPGSRSWGAPMCVRALFGDLRGVPQRRRIPSAD